MFLCYTFCFGSSPVTPQTVMKDAKILLLLQRTGGGEEAKRGGEEKRSVSEQQTAGRTFQKGTTAVLSCQDTNNYSPQSLTDLQPFKHTSVVFILKLSSISKYVRLNLDDLCPE